MKDRTKSHDDPSVSAKDCGCDPRENHKCRLHSDDKQCILGHWIRKDNCPACQVLLKEKNDA